MSMSKRDFAALARAFANFEPAFFEDEHQRANYLRLIAEISDICERHNKLFDRAKFLVACAPLTVRELNKPRKEVRRGNAALRAQFAVEGKGARG